MAKPTLLQSMLGRPSQSYSFPPEKAGYYSNKSQLLRIAAEQESVLPDDDSAQDIFYTPRSSFMSTATSTATSISSLFHDINSVSSHTEPDYALPPPPPPPPPEPPFIPVRKPPHFTKAKSICTPSIMAGMTALLEEDEGEPVTHPPKSNVLISTPHPLRPARHMPLTRSSSTTSRPKPSSSTHPSQPRRRRSRSLTLPKTPLSALPANTSSYSPSLPSHGTPGYTSLVLPRAPPSSIGVPKAPGTGIAEEGKVDLTRSGVAQTTMATVEVVKGLGEERAAGVFGIWARRKANAGNRRRGNAGAGPLGFTSYRSPPSYVPAASVLVQVWAVGVDGVDGRLVGGKLGGQNGSRKGKLEVGYIPGRSFVGRVLECGWEVKEEVVRKGEWVVGLLDVRKCGALAEFIVTDRRRVHRVPHPRMHPTPHSTANQNSLTPNHTPSIPPSSPVQSQPNESLTLEELALLPLCGIPAYRALRTFSFAPSATASIPSSSNPTSSPRPKRRVLVLRGHTGAGAMAVQMLVHQGWRVCVHAPGPGDGDGERERAYMQELEERIGAWGGEEVIFDDGEHAGRDADVDVDGAVVRVIDTLAEEGEVFDAVLDTVGGKEVWEAGEGLLRVGDGTTKKRQFTTLVGDVPARAIPSAGDNFRAGLRLLKLGNMGRDRDRDWQGAGDDGDARQRGDRNDRAKAKAKVGYAWVSVTQDVDWEGKDVRDTVGAILEMAMNGAARPRVESTVPFERTPDVFAEELPPGENPLGHGGTVVVKVVG